MKYFISVGEASGDLHASRLAKALRQADAQASFVFLGGDLLTQETGTQPVIHYRQMAFMGFSEVLRNLSTIFSNIKVARRALKEARPDVLILVDYPDFNLRLARTAREANIPVVWYIPPKVWAWKSWRVKDMRKYIDEALCIFPFEPDFLKSHGFDNAVYVGNPSVEEVDAKLAKLSSRQEFIAEHDLTSRPILALVPGSRKGEIRNNLPIMSQVARNHPDLQAIVAAAPGIDIDFYRQYTTLQLVSNDTLSLMAHAEAALVTSGTATLECALAGTPQVACYRGNGSPLTYNIMKHLLKIKYVTLPNLVADEPVIPELLINRCTAESVETELRSILPGGGRRQAMLEGYRRMRAALGSSDASRQAASHIISLAQKHI
ncbi:MAG: lipid-A-disaccharide synthase [Muribaculaceae bacterium]|nr:lipid-A-disaccharide synthase [Muribaculaceae bacterium]